MRRGSPVCRPVVMMSMTRSLASAFAASLFMFWVLLGRIAGGGESEGYGVPPGAVKRPWALAEIVGEPTTMTRIATPRMEPLRLVTSYGLFSGYAPT